MRVRAGWEVSSGGVRRGRVVTASVSMKSPSICTLPRMISGSSLGCEGASSGVIAGVALVKGGLSGSLESGL